jgi:hypothetical protein
MDSHQFLLTSSILGPFSEIPLFKRVLGVPLRAAIMISHHWVVALRAKKDRIMSWLAERLIKQLDYAKRAFTAPAWQSPELKLFKPVLLIPMYLENATPKTT